MPTTRKKPIKTVFKNDESEDDECEDFSDSGSEAYIPEASDSSSGENNEESSSDEFKDNKTRKKQRRPTPKNNIVNQTKALFKKFSAAAPFRSSEAVDDLENAAPISIKDMTAAEKLLPSILNLSESDSSDDESAVKHNSVPSNSQDVHLNFPNEAVTLEEEVPSSAYTDVWCNLDLDKSAEVANASFNQLQEHAIKLEKTKESLKKYEKKINKKKVQQNKKLDVTDLLAMGEDFTPTVKTAIKHKNKSFQDSDSEPENWEEVKEAKIIPQSGIQLIVDFPSAAAKKSKTIDIAMMMKRKMNRVKKEYQVYMHKVHVLSWIGHGNYVNHVLNDQDLLAAALSLLPSQQCYPSERVDIKYLEQITTWFSDKLTLKPDPNENKFRPKALGLKENLLKQITTGVVRSQKNYVLIFICIMRALGIKCRLMLNFVVLPLRPSSSELCSLSIKPQGKDIKTNAEAKSTKQVVESKKLQVNEGSGQSNKKTSSAKTMEKMKNIPQLDGNDDSDIEVNTKKTRPTRNKTKVSKEKDELEAVSPPKKLKTMTPVKIKQQKENGNVSNIENEIENDSMTLSKTKKQKENGNLSNKEKDKEKDTVTPVKTKKQKDNGNVSETGGKTSRISAVIKKTNPEPKIASQRPSRDAQKNGKGVPKIIVTADWENEVKKNDVSKVKSNTKSKAENKTPITAQLKNRKRTSTAPEKKIKPDTLKVNAQKNGKGVPKIIVTADGENEVKKNDVSKVKSNTKSKAENKTPITAQLENRKRTSTAPEKKIKLDTLKVNAPKARTRSMPGQSVSQLGETSKYFMSPAKQENKCPASRLSLKKDSDSGRVSHRDLLKKALPQKNYVVSKDLIKIIKKRVREVKIDEKCKLVKGKTRKVQESDSDYLPVENVPKRTYSSDSDGVFRKSKISPRPSGSKINRKVLSSDEDKSSKRPGVDVWCEVYVEDEEQWISVDVIKGQVHCVNQIYSRATHPVAYVVGWDNSNHAKDLTRRYVPYWNTVTRKLRTDAKWWDEALKCWLGPPTAISVEEDNQLDRMQLDAPLPKSISEYKNHPLYVLKRHMLKFEALYPPDAATLGFVRGEPVYSRECVFTCRSRETWLKEAKTVKMDEQPFKIVKARPKYDRMSGKFITDLPLEVYGPWQVRDYEPPVAENGIVPRNAYGNVELYKECMLPKGTVVMKLPGLNKVARKLNIDCAPAMIGFDTHGGWPHPVFDGFVVCSEFQDVLADAWHKDQEEMERKEREKIETRVYGNWRKLIKGLFIRERLKRKYAFDDPKPSSDESKKKLVSRGRRLKVKK